jgi:hypothetical protein
MAKMGGSKMGGDKGKPGPTTTSKPGSVARPAAGSGAKGGGKPAGGKGGGKGC